MTGVIAKRVGSSSIDLLARLLLQESRSVPPGFCVYEAPSTYSALA
jgi:hypothetical protein